MSFLEFLLRRKLILAFQLSQVIFADPDKSGPRRHGEHLLVILLHFSNVDFRITEIVLGLVDKFGI